DPCDAGARRRPGQTLQEASVIRPVDAVREPAHDHARAGIGLRSAHVDEIVARRPGAAWLEVHAENYMSGSPALAQLEALRRDYPVSLHGVGLSLGAAEALDRRHLARLCALCERLAPMCVSEHLSWSLIDGTYLNHLLPLPYTDETLIIVAGHVSQVQET